MTDRSRTPSRKTAVSSPSLRWVDDGRPGIRRIQAPDGAGGFGYLGVRGRPLRDAATLARIRALAIPPAWREVWICADPQGHLQATGRDARGRKQYRYHADWVLERGQDKFEQLRRFGSVLPRIRARIQRTLAGGTEPTQGRVVAALVRLLDTTWMRIGNPEYVRSNGSYGLSTLRQRHADLRGDALMLSFTGKGGVKHRVRLDDRRVAQLVRRCRELPGQELFQCVDEAGAVHSVGSAEVNEWLAEAAGCRVTAKDFRTWHGSVAALELMLAACRDDGPCRLQDLLAGVARRLGNTVAICRKAYVHPRVLAMGALLGEQGGREGLLRQAWVAGGRPRRGLSLAERQLLTLLATRQLAA